MATNLKRDSFGADERLRAMIYGKCFKAELLGCPLKTGQLAV